jgi:predicted nucleotidyltransferase
MKSKELEAVKTQLAPTFKALGVEKAILFGSISRRTGSRKSDIDLLLVVETGERFFDRYERFEEVYAKLKGRSVDMLIYTPTELLRIAHRPFIKNILAEGQTIYEHRKEHHRSLKVA